MINKKSESVLFNAALFERFRPMQTPAGEEGKSWPIGERPRRMIPSGSDTEGGM